VPRPKSPGTALTFAQPGRLAAQGSAIDLIAAAFAGIVMAGLWPAFDERACLLLWKTAPESDSGE
jgi:hypothetical protein